MFPSCLSILLDLNRNLKKKIDDAEYHLALLVQEPTCLIYWNVTMLRANWRTERKEIQHHKRDGGSFWSTTCANRVSANQPELFMWRIWYLSCMLANLSLQLYKSYTMVCIDPILALWKGNIYLHAAIKLLHQLLDLVHWNSGVNRREKLTRQIDGGLSNSDIYFSYARYLSHLRLRCIS